MKQARILQDIYAERDFNPFFALPRKTKIPFQGFEKPLFRKNPTEKNKVEEIMFFKPSLTTVTQSCPTWEYPYELWS